MDHLENRQMLEMLAGQVPSGQVDAGKRHMAECAQCRLRWEDLQATWGDLGQWDFQASDYDFTASILEKVPRAQAIADAPAVRFFRLSSMVRIAASVLLGLFVGHLAGRIPATGLTPSEQDIVQAMHLETLTLSSSTGFGEPLLESISTGSEIEL